MTQKILITGAFGYLGGRISHYLTGKYFLRLARRFDSPYAMYEHPTADIIALDLFSGRGLEKACENIDTIIHLASLDAAASAANPAEALLVNTEGTRKLLASAIHQGVKRFIYFSTIHVYGAPLVGVINEKNLACPIHPYSISRKAAEDYVLSAHLQHQLVGSVLRISNGFGCPHQVSMSQWNLVVNDLCRQTVLQNTMILKTASQQHRDFIPIHDIERVAEHFIHLPAEKMGDGLFNVGGEQVLTVQALAHIIAKRAKIILGYEPTIHQPVMTSDETGTDFVYNIDKLKQTGFTLQGSMQDEIDATLQFCLQHRQQWQDSVT